MHSNARAQPFANAAESSVGSKRSIAVSEERQLAFDHPFIEESDPITRSKSLLIDAKHSKSDADHLMIGAKDPIEAPEHRFIGAQQSVEATKNRFIDAKH